MGMQVTSDFYKRAFWLFVATLVGAAAQYGIFGYATMRRSDFDTAIAMLSVRLDKQDTNIRHLQMTNKDLIGQLRAEKLIQGKN